MHYFTKKVKYCMRIFDLFHNRAFQLIKKWNIANYNSNVPNKSVLINFMCLALSTISLSDSIALNN